MTDGELREAFNGVRKELADIKEALARDFAALHGNGRPGLLDRMAAMEAWRDGHSDVWKWIISTVIAVAAVAVAALKRG